jgi:hypothetical protein
MVIQDLPVQQVLPAQQAPMGQLVRKVHKALPAQQALPVQPVRKAPQV